MQVLLGDLFILHALARSSTSCLDKNPLQTFCVLNFSWYLQVFNILMVFTPKLLFLTFANSSLRFQSYILFKIKYFKILRDPESGE